MKELRIGYGYDVHRLVEARPLLLGGVEIPHPRGLEGHSDADVLLHAIADAMLGAVAQGDIGRHFPDNDDTYRDMDSRVLLKKVNEILMQQGYRLGNIDSTIVAQKPRLAPYIEEMRQNIAQDTGLGIDRVSVKATTSEQLGFEGTGEGISARAVVTVTRGE